MLRRTMQTAVLAMACVLVGRLAVADAGQGPERPTVATTQVVYPVADLVVPVGTDDTGLLHTAREVTKLLDLVHKTVAPDSWRSQGGTGSIQYCPKDMTLVVRQSPAVQREVAELLTALRRQQNIQVCLELRVVQMSDTLADEFSAKAGFAVSKTDDGTAIATAFFSEKELYPWLRLFQTDPDTNILMAPKVTLFSGQRAPLVITDKQRFVTEYKVVRAEDDVTVVPRHETVEIGTRFDLLPTVSADQRFVHLKLDYRQTSLAGPTTAMPVCLKVGREGGPQKEFHGVVQQPEVQTLAFKHACTIADGRTMAVPLGRVTTEDRSESDVSVLSKLPYVNRLVRNVGYARETRAVFLLVTPRILVIEEEEQAFPGALPPVPRP